MGRPKNTPKINCFIDTEDTSNGKEIFVIVDQNVYDSSSTEMMRKHAQYLLKVAEWLEGDKK